MKVITSIPPVISCEPSTNSISTIRALKQIIDILENETVEYTDKVQASIDDATTLLAAAELGHRTMI